MMNDVLPFLALGCSLAGGYFIAFLTFRKLWKSNVTHLKLIGFLATFFASFVGLMFVIGAVVFHSVPFGR